MKLLSIACSVVLLLTTPILGNVVPTIMDFEPKTLHISATGGGLSHMAWALEIGKVLAQRGHNVSFVTTEPNVKFGAPFAPEINTISMGPHHSKVVFRDLFDVKQSFSPPVAKAFMTLLNDVYKNEFEAYMHIFQSSNTDLAICDQLALPCFDAAKKLNIPMVLYITMSLSEDTKAPFINFFHTPGPPTTKTLGFVQRFYDKYVAMPSFLYRFYPVAMTLKKIRKDLGVEDFDPLARHSNVVKMINSFWGMESPRPVGPLVEYVGPIIGSTYDSLPANMAKYMDNHNKVVYIAFGQMYSPSGVEFEAILTSLLEAYEQKTLDGFIWSFSMKSRQQSDLPNVIQTKSGKVYNVKRLFDGSLDSNLRFEAWSPQFAILNHPSCKLFISHGGASSIHESLFNGVPLLLHPFTSDQPANAYTMEQAGVGLTLNRKAHSASEALEKITTILKDTDGKFKSNMDSMQALVQLKSRRKFHAADMIEEVVYSVRNKNDIWNRREESENMSFLKATNWDIDLTALGLVIGFIAVSYKLMFKMFTLLKISFVTHQKLKSA